MFPNMEVYFEYEKKYKKLEDESIEDFAGLKADIHDLTGVACAKEVAEHVPVLQDWINQQNGYFLTPLKERVLNTEMSTQLPLQLQKISELFFDRFVVNFWSWSTQIPG